jgi:hypothetical protein
VGIVVLEIWLFGMVLNKNSRIVVYFVDIVLCREIDFVLEDYFAMVCGESLIWSVVNCARVLLKQCFGAEQLLAGIKRSECVNLDEFFIFGCIKNR